MITEAVGPVEFATFDVSAAGLTQIIPADPQCRATRILGIWAAVNSGDVSDLVSIAVQDNNPDGAVPLLPAQLIAGGNAFVLPTNGIGYAETSGGFGVDVDMGAADRVVGGVTYQRVGSRGPGGDCDGTTSTTTTTTT